MALKINIIMLDMVQNPDGLLNLSDSIILK